MRPTIKLEHAITRTPILAIMAFGIFSIILSSTAQSSEIVRQVLIVNNYENPALARLILASSFEEFGVVVTVGSENGKKEQVTKKSIVELIPVPDLKSDLLYPQQFAAVRETLDRLSGLIETYPQFRVSLLPLGTELKSIVDSGSRGMVRRAGVWQETPMTPGVEGAPSFTIRDVRGKEYLRATVKQIDPDGLLISHANGISKVLFTDLPKELQERYGYDPAAALAFRESRGTASVNPAPASPGMTPTQVPPSEPVAINGRNVASPEWTPTTADEVAECALFVKVLDKIGKDDEQQSGGGTAFLCNVGGVTYIYSNVHNFDGTRKFVIVDQRGREYNQFVSVEIAADGEGYNEGLGWGGDVIRLRLPDYNPRALSLADRPITDADVGRDILVTGNTKDRDQITKLTGKITAIEPNEILKINALAQAGNSGSPIVDLESYRVLGIFTWGAYDDQDPLFDLWSKKPPEERGGIGSGPCIADMKFETTTLDALYNHRVVFNQLNRNARLLGLLDTLYPRKEGVFVDTEQIVFGDYTVIDLLRESPDHLIVNELTALHERLEEKAESNVGISNQDMFKAYIGTYMLCLRDVVAFRRRVEEGRMPTFYMQCNFEKTRIIEISKAYEDVLSASVGWYEDQGNTRGESWPIAKRIRLPEFRSGIDGLLQIKE